MSEVAINPRAQQLLKLLVERYIRDGTPVGSRTLARECRLELSPATIRNVMSDLEDMGLICAPHTSSGRIPTAQGYRLFVDNLLSIQPLKSDLLPDLRYQIGAEQPEDVLSSASSLLSELTSMAGVVMVPRHNRESLRQLEFLPLSGNRVLVIIVTNETEVQNRIIDTKRTYSASELEQMANYLNHSFAGHELSEVRTSLVHEMEEDKQRMDQMMSDALEMASRVLDEEDTGERDYIIAGETNLMNYAEMSDIESLRQLFEAFNQKREILQLLDQSLTAEGIQIFIGEESGYEALEGCSVVTAPYTIDENVIGVLGVIGPTRMSYERVIPIVDVTAKLVGMALNQRF